METKEPTRNGEEEERFKVGHVRPRVKQNRRVGSTPHETTTTTNQQQQQQSNKGILKSTYRYTTATTKSLVTRAQAATNLESKEQDATTVGSKQKQPLDPDSIIVQERQHVRRRNQNPATTPLGVVEKSIFSNDSQSSSTTQSLLSKEPCAIEGYIPKIRPQQEKTKNPHDNWTFNSLSQLMERAGTLPEQNISPESMIEADLKFSVMSPEEFEETIQRQEDGDVDGEEPNPAEPRDESDTSNSDQEEEDDDDDENQNYNPQDNTPRGCSLLDFLGPDDDPEPVESRPERAFLQLWKALSQWVTPEAAEFVVLQQKLVIQQQRQEGENNNSWHSGSDSWFVRHWNNDIENSRCAGLMALLQSYLSSCLTDDLHRPLEDRRNVELLLGQLIRRLDFSQPSPKLGANLARALTCILVQTVRPDYCYYDNDDPDHPVAQCCAEIGLTKEEHQYLVKSALANFHSS